MKTPEEIKKLLSDYRNYTFSLKELLSDTLAYIQQLEAAQPKWISVEERLPDTYETVIVRNDTDAVCAAQYWGEESGWKREMIGCCRSEIGVHVTHWMPLPDYP